MNTTTLEPIRINLPHDTLRALKEAAVEQGKSLKEYIVSILESQATALQKTVSTNPSPSGDSWFDDPNNMLGVMEGLADYKSGRCVELSIEEIEKRLGL